MKIKSIVLSVVLSICGVFSVFAFAGCGQTSLATLKENFVALESVYEENKSVFQHGNCDGVPTELLINYGSVVDGYIATNKAGYVELRDVYNSILAISSDYIKNNKEFIINFSETDLTKEAKSAITTLNKSLVDYKDFISTFVKERQNLIDYFDQFGNKLDESADLARLRNFKKYYGELVEKSVKLSTDLADAVKTTEIFDLLKITEPSLGSTKVIKEYMRAKMLPIFSEFMISEVENKLNWNGFTGGAKEEIDALLQVLNQKFEYYKLNLVVSAETLKVFESKESMNEFFDLVENFIGETDIYLKALKELNISEIILNSRNDFVEYEKKNPMARTYFAKLEQFIKISLEDFLVNATNIIYER